jgi:putative ABC transport system substrate-binding protein
MWRSTVGIIVTLTLSLLATPLAPNAQPPRQVARIGFLSSTLARSVRHYQAFEQRLRELGYVEGQNLAIEFRNAEGQAERLPALAAELVQRQVDVLVAAGPEATLRAATDATSTIPIVMVAINYDPIALGYVSGLARPGGHITGVVAQQPELHAKRLDLLRQALPGVTRVAVLWDAFAGDLSAAEDAARVLNVQLQALELRDPPYDFARALDAAVQGHADALLFQSSPVFFRERVRLAELALAHRLPSMFMIREYVEAGGFMSYGVNLAAMFQRGAVYVAKILQGAKPADLPVEQPWQFELVINLKTAQALGLTLAPEFLFLADEVLR